MAHWQVMAVIRSENERVLLSFEQFPDASRAERAQRLGMGEFALVLVIRRLLAVGRLCEE